MPLRLIFMGTPDFAVPTLLELVAHGHEVVAVYTRAPKPAGRGMKLQPTPVEQEARRLRHSRADANDAEDAGSARGIPRAQCRCGRRRRLRHDPAAGHSGCAKARLLQSARLAAAALARRRPINRAIMAGDAETGVMVMKMDVGLDTGDVAMAERLAITDTMTAADLHDALAPLGADLMVRAMGGLARGGLQLQKQSEDGVTYAAKIDKAEARIDWQRPARAVLRHIHGLSPFPGAWCEIASDSEPARIKISALRTGEGFRRARRGARRSPDDCLR